MDSALGKSTTTSIIIFTTYIAKSLEAGYQVNTITTDFRKAFGTVSHYLLISKHEYLSVGNPLLSWLKSYLTGRKQLVSILGSSSKLFEATSGVSQGCHPSLLLFSIW